MIPADIGVRTPTSFSTLGPFELPRRKGHVDISNLDSLWDSLEQQYPGLGKAVGVYIVATKKGNSAPKPWYVGKTERGFRKRFIEHAKKGSAFDPVAERAPNGHLQVFVLPRKLPSGKFLQAKPYPNKKPQKSINRLEFALIGACFLRNKRLLNTSNKTFHATLSVPGFMNSSGKPSKSARQLKLMLKSK